MIEIHEFPTNILMEEIAARHDASIFLGVQDVSTTESAEIEYPSGSTIVLLGLLHAAVVRCEELIRKTPEEE